ncbi:hypothetical protein WOSG25_090740 [Weissella oryzae SG25]|uniref:Uncharacterized protein n=1 Tax=Weissella oryzae (strain DSM 25784 / JCM 18191 / LMG 30913 / SG25) TaxID=1329250 RepID=A0A069D1Y7_WEIOS|nr:hypothetical protein [Weissella oryzae]GAK31376.1 hypothetical protein WOSG25_090740 [Weissella oryzae SG25]
MAKKYLSTKTRTSHTFEFYEIRQDDPNWREDYLRIKAIRQREFIRSMMIGLVVLIVVCGGLFVIYGNKKQTAAKDNESSLVDHEKASVSSSSTSDKVSSSMSVETSNSMSDKVSSSETAEEASEFPHAVVYTGTWTDKFHYGDRMITVNKGSDDDSLTLEDSLTLPNSPVKYTDLQIENTDTKTLTVRTKRTGQTKRIKVNTEIYNPANQDTYYLGYNADNVVTLIYPMSDAYGTPHYYEFDYINN